MSMFTAKINSGNGHLEKDTDLGAPMTLSTVKRVDSIKHHCVKNRGRNACRSWQKSRALLIDGSDDLSPEERAVLTSLLWTNSSDVVNEP